MPLGEGKEWKERGIGLLHLNQNIHDQRRGRLGKKSARSSVAHAHVWLQPCCQSIIVYYLLVMRSEGNLKLILNAVIYETMKFEKIQDRHVRFVSVENEQPCVYLLKASLLALSLFLSFIQSYILGHAVPLTHPLICLLF